ncbi:hypothetical protein U9M48_040818 [Paspalum notatum var. saurae]|uniref:Uncharacterized protein n=1 Tax=Paspalum notatum var. saurae TaxID=547442 RepID=A0AAQ3UT56_PASNO
MQLLPLQQTLQLLPLDEAWGLQSGEGRFHAAAVRMAGHTEPFYQWSVNRVTMSQTPQAAPAKRSVLSENCSMMSNGGGVGSEDVTMRMIPRNPMSVVEDIDSVEAVVNGGHCGK